MAREVKKHKRDLQSFNYFGWLFVRFR
jgi:hypothetical protein